MRVAIRLLAVFFLTLGLAATTAWAEPWSRKGYVQGQVISAGSHYGYIDMGYAHRVRPFQQVAIFRSRNKVYHPIGVFRLDRVDATQSVIRQTAEATVRPNDLVMTMERDLVPLEEGGFLEDHYVRTHIVNRRTLNGYDTGLGDSVSNAFRVQSHEIRSRRSAAWEEGFKRVGDEKRALETDPRRALILQLEYFREEAKRHPKSFAAMSRQWKQVVMLLEQKVTVSDMAPTINDSRIRIASTKFAPELDDEAAELIAFMISKGIASTGEQEATIRATFKNSQYVKLNSDDRLPPAIATFIREFLAADSGELAPMP